MATEPDSPRRWLTPALTGALLGAFAALVAVYLIGWRYPEPPHTLVPILVTWRPIPQGTKLVNRGEWFEVEEVVKGQEPGGAIHWFDLAQGKRVNKTLQAGHVLTEEDFMGPSGISFWPGPPGLRALRFLIANRGEDLKGIEVGSRVNVRSDRQEKVWDPTSLVVNRLVEATGFSREGDETSGNSITLWLSQEEVERVGLARQNGENLTVVLGSP
jgi:hypothetical protein